MKELHFDKKKFTKDQVKDETKKEGPGNISETKNFHVFKRETPVKHEKIADGVVVKKLDKKKAVSNMKSHMSSSIKGRLKDNLRQTSIEKNIEEFTLEMFLLVPGFSQSILELALKLLNKMGLPTEATDRVTKKIENIGEELSASMITAITPVLMDVILDFI